MSTTVIYAGESSSGLVADYSNTIIVSGGTAVDTTIDYGAMSVFLAGAQVSNTVMSGGILYASAGQIENTTMDDGAVFSALYSVDITGTTINSGGTASFRASSVKDTIVNSGGRIDIYGGTVTNTTVNQGSMSLANSNAAAYNTFITGSGYYTVLQVQNSATITGTTVESNAYLRLSYGAVANDTILNRGGNLIVSSGATAANTTINDGGSMSIEGGNADLVMVNSGGWFSAGYSWNGANAAASATQVKENGGAVYVGSGSSYEYDYELGSYTYQYFTYPVEFVSNTFSGLVYSGYRGGTVHSGTTAVDITAIVGGLTVYSGGKVSGYNVTPYTHEAVQTSWIYSSSYNEETSSWDYTSSPVVSNVEVTELGGLTVSSGGIVTGLVAAALPDNEDYYNTYMTFQIAPDTEITGTIDGTPFEMKNGILTNASVKDINLMYMSGANVSNVSQYNGSATVLAGAHGKDLNFSGTSVVFSKSAVVDGVRTFVVPYSYYEYGMGGDSDSGTLVETSRGADIKFLAGATVTNLDMDSVSHLYMEVAPFTILTGTSGGATIDMQNGYFGGIAIDNTYVQVKAPFSFVDELGNVVVNGGTVSDLIVNNGAVVNAENNTTALNMTENGGAVYVCDNDEEPSVIYSFNENTFSNLDLHGEVTVHKNTIARDNFLYDGTLNVYSGGIVNNFYTAASGMGGIYAGFQSGAIVSNFDMVRFSEQPYHPGEVFIDSGVHMDTVRLTDWNGLTLNVGKDSVITNAAIDNIPFSVSNGVLSGFVANGDGWFSDYITVGSGAMIIDSYINSWGQVTLEDGAYANNLTLANNYFYVNSGSLAENVLIGLPPEVVEEDGYTYTNYNNASAYVNKGGVLSDFTVNDYSNVEVNSGGKVTGKMRLDGGNISISGGGTVDFDITAQDALNESRLNDLRRLYNSSPSADPFSMGAKYTITVDGQNQAAGKYTLANNAYLGYYNYLYLTVLDATTGEDYGYFEGYYTTVWQPDESYEIEFMSHFAGNAPSGFSYWLNAERVERDDGVIDFDLVLTVESEIAPAEWLAAPTVDADEIRFTNNDVLLTISAQDGVTKEYSLNCEDWTVCGDTFSAMENGVYYFRVSDGDLHSEATMYRVSNIDKDLPTVPGLPMVFVDEQTVSFSWGEATDDFSGIYRYTLTVWNDGGNSYTYDTPWNGYELTDFYSGTWHWTIQAGDYAGNMSDAIYGDDFTIEGGDVPRLDLPNFLVGNFLSDATNSQMGTVEHGNNGNAITIYSNGAPWGNGLFLDPGWDLAGVGDFDADGQDDFLRINGDGYVVGELTQDNGAFVPQVLNFKNAGWEVLGTGDFSGNGSDDVLIANPTGASDTVGLLGYWESGVTWTLINGYSAEWECIATGDFNADGKCDMLWRNSFVGDGDLTYNAYCTWIVEDPVDWRMVSVANPAEWNFLCAGDFNGDGMNDIAMINDVGVVGIWGVNDGWLSSWSILSAVDTSEWKLVGVGDFNGDNTDDIAWCSNISGLAGYWQIEDKTLAGWANLASLA